MLDELVTTRERLRWWVDACTAAGICGFDTETTGLKVVEGKDRFLIWVFGMTPRYQSDAHAPYQNLCPSRCQNSGHRDRGIESVMAERGPHQYASLVSFIAGLLSRML